MGKEVDASLTDRIMSTCYDRALNGLPLTPTARELGDRYWRKHVDPDVAIDRLIGWQAAKCGTSGFLTGLGGLLTLPVAIPADIVATWYVNIRMVAAIAHIRGHDLRAEGTKSAVFLCLVGDDAVGIAGRFGAKTTEERLAAQLEGLDPSNLARMNRAVAFRLVTKLGEKGITKFFKLAPLLGGAVRGTVNVVSCAETGKTAKRLLVMPEKARAAAKPASPASSPHRRTRS